MFHYVESKVETSHGSALLSYMCVCTRQGFHFTVLLISFAPPYYAHSYANHWSVAQRQRQMENGEQLRLKK